MKNIMHSAPSVAVLSLLVVLASSAVSQEARPPSAGSAPKKTPVVTIAVVRDGASSQADSLVDDIFGELAVLTEGELDVRRKESPDFNAGSEPSRMRATLQRAFDDPEVDMVLVEGIVATRAAAAWDGELPKPVLSGFVLDADVLDLKYTKEERSTKKNFTYVVTLGRARSDVRTFHRMIGFDTLHVLVSSSVLEGLDHFEDQDLLFEEATGIDMEYLPVGDSAADVLGLIDDDVQAVYLTAPIQIDAGEWQRLIDGLNARGIPTFAMRGISDVERGALAGLLPEMRQTLARRLALNLQQIMLGTPPEDLRVSLRVEEKLTVNARTAIQIGYSPDLQTMRDATILHADEFDTGSPLTLEQAMELAVDNNVDIAIQSAVLEGSRQDRNRARSVLFPQIDGSADYSQIDGDRAGNSLGLVPKDLTSVGFTIRQLLYDDEAVTRFRAACRNLDSQRFAYESTRLDIMAAAGLRFLEFLQARALYRIESDNLGLTQRNLELARIRVDVGTSGPEDQHRWEAQEAQQRSSVLRADTVVNQSRVALNQTLGVDQNMRWIPIDIRLDDGDFYFLEDETMQAMVSNMRALERLRAYTAMIATRNSPDLKGLAELMAAQDLVVNQRKRAFILPSFAAGFSFDHFTDRSYIASSGGELGLPTVTPEDDEWTFFVSASLPLFIGGRKFHDLAGARADYDRLSLSFERVRQLTEQRSVSALFAMESSHPSIRLSRQGADSARKNLDIIQDKYAQGAVDIIVLLDAQNESFTAEQAAVIAVYTYLQDLVAYQRSISWFEKFAPEEERKAIIPEMESYLAESE